MTYQVYGQLFGLVNIRRSHSILLDSYPFLTSLVKLLYPSALIRNSYRDRILPQVESLLGTELG